MYTFDDSISLHKIFSRLNKISFKARFVLNEYIAAKVHLELIVSHLDPLNEGYLTIIRKSFNNWLQTVSIEN